MLECSCPTNGTKIQLYALWFPLVKRCHHFSVNLFSRWTYLVWHSLPNWGIPGYTARNLNSCQTVNFATACWSEADLDLIGGSSRNRVCIHPIPFEKNSYVVKMQKGALPCLHFKRERKSLFLFSPSSAGQGQKQCFNLCITKERRERAHSSSFLCSPGWQCVVEWREGKFWCKFVASQKVWETIQF